MSFLINLTAVIIGAILVWLIINSLFINNNIFKEKFKNQSIEYEKSKDWETKYRKNRYYQYSALILTILILGFFIYMFINSFF